MAETETEVIDVEVQEITEIRYLTADSVIFLLFFKYVFTLQGNLKLVII